MRYNAQGEEEEASEESGDIEEGEYESEGDMKEGEKAKKVSDFEIVSKLV